jgi:pyruvate/2-oxoglutarate dehydrogenase complex dihydrolipoamide dehydrogenase (E3) component/uncharacterized membrane protein YdjX (TVP38/TMEM64 family)
VKKLTIAAAIASIAIAFLVFDLGRYLELEQLRQWSASLKAAQLEKPLLIIGAFFLIYVLVTATSLPGAAVLTLAGGAIFGLFTGTILVSFASTLGAVLAFLSSRHVLRDFVEARFGERLKPINAGLERDGAFYLFTLRMVPLFPFFAVNLAMGLTRIKTWTYAWVSQAGMLLGTIAYVNAGTQLATVESLSDVISPGILVSFAALGILPWVTKGIVGVIARRRVYRGFQRPKRFDRNLIVIGAGSAGLVSALIGTTVRARVTLVEKDRMGGDCLNTGCVPSKALIRSASVAAQVRDAGRFGIGVGEPEIRFADVLARVKQTVAAIEPNDSVARFVALGVDVALGTARIVDPWTVEITGKDGTPRQLSSRAIVIAAGAAPFVPPLPGLDETGYLTSDTLWDEFAGMTSAPRQVCVLGGGPIGCELSQALARLGSNVTLVEMADRLLVREDDEVSAAAHDALSKSGVNVLTGHRAVRAEARDGNKFLAIEGPGGLKTLAFDQLIVAVGRIARLTGYGLEELGIDTKKVVPTDDFLATRFPNIYAAGDVAGPYQFTHAASHQAWHASVNALFGQFWRFKVDYRFLPHTTFLSPQIARVGLNEREAAELGIACEITRYDFADLDRAIAEGETTGFVKILTVPGKDRILGVTIVGAQAGELLAEYVLAMKHGLGLKKILGTIHAYPTLAEANKFAAGEWQKARKPERLLKLVEAYHTWRRG